MLGSSPYSKTLTWFYQRLTNQTPLNHTSYSIRQPAIPAGCLLDFYIMNSELQQAFDDATGELAIGEYQNAIDGYRRCVAIDPDFFDGWQALGLSLMKVGEYKEAIGCGIKATTLKPNDQLAWTALSQMYVQDQQIAEAEHAKQNATILGIGGKVDKSRD